MKEKLKRKAFRLISSLAALWLIAPGQIDTALGQCDTSRWKASIDPGAGGAITEVIPAQDIFQGGVLTASPSVSFPDPYYVSFTLHDTFCITNNFSVEIKLKNDPATGGAVSGDTWLSLTGSGITAGCLIEGDPAAQQYTSIYVGSSYMSNLPELVMDLSSWRTIRLDFINNVVNWSYDGANFFSMSYTGSICNINNLLIGFREAGQIDYIKIFDASNTTVYYEEFNDCNNLAIVPDCIAPMVTAASLMPGYCQYDSIKLTGIANVSVQYTWTGPDGFTSTLASPAIANAQPVNSGWYILTGYVNPCTPVNKDSVYIEVHPQKYTSVYPYICPGDSYFAAGNNQTAAGLYYDTLAASSGCDSIILTYLSLLSTSASANTVFICEGDSFLAGGQYQHVTGNYADTLVNSDGCDSVITTMLTVIPPVYSGISHYICLGDSFFVGGNYQSSPGLYLDTLTTVAGCDSIIMTNLDVIAPVTTLLNVAICEGDSYYAGGAMQTQPGSYSDTMASALGCDSVIVTNLQVIAPVYGYRTVFICQDDSFFTGGNYQSAAGLYLDTLISASGCDSVLTTDLQIILPVYQNLNAFICQGDSLFVGGSYQQLPGIYYDTLTSSTGCDSIIITQLQEIVPVFSTHSVTLCQGDSLWAGGGYQTAGGTYLDTLQSISGCDSVVTTIIQLVLPTYTSTSITICNGESYFAGGAWQTAAGSYQDTIQSVLGCDSIVTTQLQVLFPVCGNQSVSICDGSSYFAGGFEQTLPGIYYDTLSASSGCDSILITQLFVWPNPFVYLGQDTTLCEGTAVHLSAGSGFQDYVWHDGSNAEFFDANSTGIFSVTVTDLNGCTTSDTLIIYEVYPNPEDFLHADTTACGAFSWVITVPGYIEYQWSHGFTGESAAITLPGTYTLEVTDDNGCKGSDVLVIESSCDQAILMPNAFTPNGDGMNDVLKPILLDDISDYELTIFNRWGKVIFRSGDPAEGWDGREADSDAVMEQYVWTVQYKNGNGVEQFEKGNAALLR